MSQKAKEILRLIQLGIITSDDILDADIKAEVEAELATE